jgi:hypothetical protein
MSAFFGRQGNCSQIIELANPQALMTYGLMKDTVRITCMLVAAEDTSHLRHIAKNSSCIKL